MPWPFSHLCLSIPTRIKPFSKKNYLIKINKKKNYPWTIQANFKKLWFLITCRTAWLTARVRFQPARHFQEQSNRHHGLSTRNSCVDFHPWIQGNIIVEIWCQINAVKIYNLKGTLLEICQFMQNNIIIIKI